jgi:hypothetical protein
MRKKYRFMRGIFFFTIIEVKAHLKRCHKNHHGASVSLYSHQQILQNFSQKYGWNWIICRFDMFERQKLIENFENVSGRYVDVSDYWDPKNRLWIRHTTSHIQLVIKLDNSSLLNFDKNFTKNMMISEKIALATINCQIQFAISTPVWRNVLNLLLYSCSPICIIKKVVGFSRHTPHKKIAPL